MTACVVSFADWVASSVILYACVEPVWVRPTNHSEYSTTIREVSEQNKIAFSFAPGRYTLAWGIGIEIKV